MLTKKELEVIELRQSNMTQIEVAKQLKISQAAVSNFEKNALKKIKESYNTLSIARKLNVGVLK